MKIWSSDETEPDGWSWVGGRGSELVYNAQTEIIIKRSSCFHLALFLLFSLYKVLLLWISLLDLCLLAFQPTPVRRCLEICCIIATKTMKKRYIPLYSHVLNSPRTISFMKSWLVFSFFFLVTESTLLSHLRRNTRVMCN